MAKKCSPGYYKRFHHHTFVQYTFFLKKFPFRCFSSSVIRFFVFFITETFHWKWSCFNFFARSCMNMLWNFRILIMLEICSRGKRHKQFARLNIQIFTHWCYSSQENFCKKKLSLLLKILSCPCLSVRKKRLSRQDNKDGVFLC